jgi:hypothetical protein
MLVVIWKKKWGGKNVVDESVADEADRPSKGVLLT